MEIKDIFGEMNSAIVTGVAGLAMGLLLKVMTKWTDRKNDNLTEHLELRKELREELDSVKHELHQLQKELDEWREKYYHQVEINTILQSEVAALRLELKEYRERTDEHDTKPFNIGDIE